jgi:hypothetical protein
MWETLKEKLDSTTSYIGRTAIVTQFQNAPPGESISAYIAYLRAYQFQLQGSTEEYRSKPSFFTFLRSLNSPVIAGVIAGSHFIVEFD